MRRGGGGGRGEPEFYCSAGSQTSHLELVYQDADGWGGHHWQPPHRLNLGMTEKWCVKWMEQHVQAACGINISVSVSQYDRMKLSVHKCLCMCCLWNWSKITYVKKLCACTVMHYTSFFLKVVQRLKLQVTRYFGKQQITYPPRPPFSPSYCANSCVIVVLQWHINRAVSVWVSLMTDSFIWAYSC